MINKKIGIIGCGNMGEAIYSRLARVMEKDITLIVSETDGSRRDALFAKHKIAADADNDRVFRYSDIIIIAVKPKDFESVLAQGKTCSISTDKLLISIAAGVTTKHIELVVGKEIPVIRAMPNMPAVIGEAISSISAGSSATEEHMNMAREIFSMIGTVVEVEEKLVDAVTAISGSGPAYFFYFIENLIEAAKDLKLDDDTARELVIKTALGSAKLLDQSGEDPGLLRRKVTSKGGTTEAAIKVFDNKNLKEIIAFAAEAACKRSKELSGG